MNKAYNLVRDTAKFMAVIPYHVFLSCLAYEDRDIDNHKQEAQWAANKYIETSLISQEVEDFCLKILTGKIPVFDEKGKVRVPPKFPKK